MKTIKYFLISFSILFFNLNIAFCQFYDNNWMTGFLGLYKGGYINFTNTIPFVDSINSNSKLNVTNSTMSDSAGNLIFYTNGVNIFDSTHSIMMNGDSLSPCTWTNSFSLTGLNLIQGTLILPVPGQNNLYYLFHESWDLYSTTVNFHPATLYFSIIDMTLNNGLGAVIQKNDTLYHFQPGLVSHGLAATRHANGRDWWLIHHKAQSNEFLIWLISISGISGPFFQSIGLPPFYLAGRDLNREWCFSLDGTKLAFIAHAGGSNGSSKRVDYFNFDRCSGQLSNPQNFSIIDSSYYASGSSFSPNGRFLYVNSDYFIYQYDTWSTNIATSRQTVAVLDTNLFLGYLPSFTLMQIGPDGKIYITCDAAPDYLDVINNPDLLGVNCNITQHSFNTLARNYSLPNNPNYRLSSLVGSPCDTISNISSINSSIIDIKLTPNPNSGKFILNYSLPQNEAGTLGIVDVLGNQVYSQYIPAYSNTQTITTDNINKGIYVCILKSRNYSKIIKFLKQ